MGYRLRDVMDGIDYTELKKLKDDLTHGGLHLRKFVDTKIAEHEKKHESICVGCHTPIDQYSTTNYTLVFGPSARHSFHKQVHEFWRRQCDLGLVNRIRATGGLGFDNQPAVLLTGRGVA